MKIILSRHGNTFNSGERAVWVGCRNDLPLVTAGIEQARTLGKNLKQTHHKIAAVYCGPLQRTHVYAKIVLEELGLTLKPIIDDRLNEIDYGDWTGLSNDQIRAQFGAEELEAWEKYSRWPQHANWQDSEQLINEQIKSLANNLLNKYQSDDTILIISSNGRLRYFLNLVANGLQQQIEKQTFKVTTGNICQLTYQQQWEIDYWNLTPAAGLKDTAV